VLGFKGNKLKQLQALVLVHYFVLSSAREETLKLVETGTQDQFGLGKGNGLLDH
jgi:hypothetical protein